MTDIAMVKMLEERDTQLAELREKVATMATHRRINVEDLEDGSIRVCFGDHDKSHDCQWQRFIPEGENEQLRAEALRLEKNNALLQDISNRLLPELKRAMDEAKATLAQELKTLGDDAELRRRIRVVKEELLEQIDGDSPTDGFYSRLIRVLDGCNY